MPLNDKQKRHLKQLAHHLKPVILTGQAGISEGVINETDIALSHHELIKARINAADRDQRKAMIAELCEKTGAELVQSIGHIAVLYRPNPDEAKIQLP